MHKIDYMDQAQDQVPYQSYSKVKVTSVYLRFQSGLPVVYL